MLESIKSTLTRILGPDSARVVSYYVDQKLALKDPAAFEKALSDFLGSKAGDMLIEAIKSDLRAENAKSVPEQVSRFLKAPPPPPSSGSASAKGSGGVTIQTTSMRTDQLQERFLESAKLAQRKGITFRNLVTEGLVATQGETCGYATLACLGMKTLDSPTAFAEKAGSTFSDQGGTLLESLTEYFEKKLSFRSSVPG